MSKATSKVIIYPGTFNPITTAHIQLAQKAVEFIKADKCIILPTGTNDFKTTNISGENRLQMIQKCLPDLNRGTARYEVSDYEITHVNSYTYLSLSKLQNEVDLKASEIYILMGDDNALEIQSWKESEKLMRDYNFLVYPRYHQINTLEREMVAIWGNNKKNVIILPCDTIDVSATQIREYLRLGAYDTAKAIMPSKVFNHIILNNYYNIYTEKPNVLKEIYENLDAYLLAFDENAEKIINDIMVEMREKLEQSGCKGFVLGMSGGVDCSVMAALCHRGNIPLKLISMPNGGSMSGNPSRHAQMVADDFANGELDVRDIQGEVQAINSIANQSLESCDMSQQSDSDMAYANIAPRVRMTVLYTVAQRMNYLVLGTSNLSELTMGYFTKWGDGAADIEPISPYLKSEVKVLARHLLISDEIIDKQPSAELWDGQTDEDEMGVTYHQIDSYKRLGVGESDVIEKIKTAESRNYHKRVNLLAN